MSDEEEVITNLTEFVSNGGSLYASGTAYWIVEQIDPAAIDFEGDDSSHQSALIGQDGEVDATVMSPGLEEEFPTGIASIDLKEGYALMVDVRDDVEVLVETNIAASKDDPADVRPLTVRWTPFEGGGTVVFTSFHNHEDIDSYGWHILFEMITSL